MSKLAPISFPEDKHAVATPSSGFPYAAIDGGQPQSDQNTGYGANRMQSDHMQSDRMQPNRMQPNRMQQLEAMLHEAQGRAEIIEKEAYDKAYLAGEKAGMALGKKRGEQLLGSLQESLQDATDELTAMRQSFAEAAMDVAGFIASQILTDALDSDHSRLWEIARQAACWKPNHPWQCSVAMPPSPVAAAALFPASRICSSIRWGRYKTVLNNCAPP